MTEVTLVLFCVTTQTLYDVWGTFRSNESHRSLGSLSEYSAQTYVLEHTNDSRLGSFSLESHSQNFDAS